jgi:hypothetical protein
MKVNGQTLDQILKKHFDIIGTKNLQYVNIIRYYGIYKNHFLKTINKNLPASLFNANIEMTLVRNKNYLLQIRNEQGTNMYGFSSNVYWNGREGTLAKWNPIDNDRLLIQLKIDFEGFFYHSKEKGIQLRKLEDRKFKGSTCYRIEAITPEEDTLYYYINQKSYLLERIGFGKDINESENQIYIAFYDYKDFEGVKIPFRIMNNIKMLDGSFGKKEEIITRVEFNPEINLSIFEYENYIKP